MSLLKSSAPVGPQPFVSRPELGNSRWLGGHLVSFLATGTTTGGRLTVFRLQGVPGQEPLAHAHQLEDEVFYLLRGRLEFQLGGRCFCAEPGDTVLLPRGVEHSYRLLSGDSEILVICAPSGLEQPLRKLSQPATQLAPRPQRLAPNPAQMLSAFSRFGLTFFPPESPAPRVTPRADEPRRPAPGRSLWHLNHLVTPLVLNEETQDRFALLDVTCPCGTEPPLHVHQLEDEAFYVLEGEASFLVGKERLAARAGDLVFLPRGLAHTYEVHSPTLRFLLLVTPGDFSNFYLRNSQPAPRPGLPPFNPCLPAWEEMIRACQPYGLELIRR